MIVACRLLLCYVIKIIESTQMHLLDIKSMLGVEDFAAAHEPLNDGVKPVPNAHTVAASSKPAPVKEPAAEKPVDKPLKEDTTSEAPTKEVEAKEPVEPEVKEDTPPLEHATEKATKTELEKTEKETKALESYLPKAERFDIIGYPRRDQASLEHAVGFLQRRSGLTCKAVISSESISNAVQLGHKRISSLTAQLAQHRKVSLESQPETFAEIYEPEFTQADVVEEIAVTEAPTESNAEPLAAAVAEDLTLQETDPLDVDLLEIQKVEQTIDSLTQAGGAIEQYIQIVRANPKMSKQAAAVLHAGLEHIDQTCSLKVRSTGLESYDTSPRAAMEAADVNEKTLLDRASEIGAKIIKVIKDLMNKIQTSWGKLSNGITAIEAQAKGLELIIDGINSDAEVKEVVITNPSPMLFLGDEFIGDLNPIHVNQALSLIQSSVKEISTQVIGPISAIIKSGINDETVTKIENIISSVSSNDNMSIELPGGMLVKRVGLTLVNEISETNHANTQAELVVEGKDQYSLSKYIEAVLKTIEKIGDADVITLVRKDHDRLLDALVKSRNKETDEVVFQQVQKILTTQVLVSFNPTQYFQLLRHLAAIIHARLGYIEKLAKSLL